MSAPSSSSPSSTVVAASMPAWKSTFLQVCLDASILRFGQYTLKSGRVSPYFFNVGDFNTSLLTNALCTAYAECLASYVSPLNQTATGQTDQKIGQPLEFDVLFGPAYKGCGLSYGVVMKLGEVAPARFGRVGFCHDRKEKKDHGEGGSLVGMTDLRGKRVVIVDDVVTAGTAKRDAIELIQREGGIVVAIVVALDRQEKLPRGEGGSPEDRGTPGESRGSAIGQLRQEYGIDVISVINLDDLITGMRAKGLTQQADACEDYRKVYRASD